MLEAALLAALLLLSILNPAHALRILQLDGLSNTDACLGIIPKCEPGACTSRIVQGVSRWSCLRCLGNYQPVFDDSGQATVVQCGRLTVTILLLCNFSCFRATWA